jgi:hypothetical protein
MWIWSGSRIAQTFVHSRPVLINTIKKLLRHETTSSDDSDSDSDASESEAYDRLDDNQFSDWVVAKFRLNEAVFDKIVTQFPKNFEDYRMKYEFDDSGSVIIRAIPADIHARVVQAWSNAIEAWGNNHSVDDTNERR